MNRPTILISAFLMLAACSESADSPETEKPEAATGKVELIDAKASDVLLAVRELKAKAVLVNFWAST